MSSARETGGERLNEGQIQELRDLIIRTFGMKYNLSNDEIKQILIAIPEVALLNEEDHMNILGWVTAASILIEAETRVHWRDSELKTMEKLKVMETTLRRNGERR